MAKQARATEQQLAKMKAMDPGETLMLQGLKRQAVAYHMKQLPGDYRLAQWGDVVRVERLGGPKRPKRPGNAANFAHRLPNGAKTQNR